MLNGPSALTQSATTLSTNGGVVSTGSVDGASGGAQALTINAGSGAVSLGDVDQRGRRADRVIEGITVDHEVPDVVRDRRAAEQQHGGGIFQRLEVGARIGHRRRGLEPEQRVEGLAGRADDQHQLAVGERGEARSGVDLLRDRGRDRGHAGGRLRNQERLVAGRVAQHDAPAASLGQAAGQGQLERVHARHERRCTGVGERAVAVARLDREAARGVGDGEGGSIHRRAVAVVGSSAASFAFLSSSLV